MIKKYLGALIMVLLVAIAGVSFFKYFKALKDKRELSAHLKETRAQMLVLEHEKSELRQSLAEAKKIQSEVAQDNAVLKTTLKANEERVSKLEAAFKEMQKSFDALSSQNTALSAENSALREQRDTLDIQVYRLSEENELLKTRFNSVIELRKAMKELRRGGARAPGELPLSGASAHGLGIGNSGFIIKEGQPTYSSKVKIEVEPRLRFE
jgi:small-conductance mechanosensitive channel